MLHIGPFTSIGKHLSNILLSLFYRGQWMVIEAGNWARPAPTLVNKKASFRLAWIMVGPGNHQSVQFSSVQSLSHVWLFATPWTTACQASLSITNSWSLPKFMSIESVTPSKHIILCRPLLLLPSIFHNIRVFSDESLLTSSGKSTDRKSVV